MKIWLKNNSINNKKIENFTVGNDRSLDLLMAEFDVLGSLAHTKMLETIGLLTKDELVAIHKELKNIFSEIKSGNFKMDENAEDIHSQIEYLLTERIGEAGKKIHSGRSRNDQVLVDIKLFIRNEIQKNVSHVKNLFDELIALSEKHKNILLPGYTHLQIAMPSSFGLWFGSYAESLVDDLEMMLAAYKITNKNPLGSAAGYGSSFPLNRTLTTELLGFENLNYNVVYAQMTRGKTEKCVAMALSSVASTLSKIAMDVCLYMSQNFNFISFPDELTTGSSIMPHKKNPDVFELIRAKCNRLQALPTELGFLTSNLPSGYHRDLQLTKEILFPAFFELNACVEMMIYMLKNIRVREHILDDEKYNSVFSVEEVNAQVIQGIPFREAYKNVANLVDEKKLFSSTKIQHTHEGSIGNLCNDKISQMMANVLNDFNFNKTEIALKKLR